MVAGEDGWREVCSLGASPECLASLVRPQKISEGSARRADLSRAGEAREGPMTVFVYVNTSKQVGDADHIKVFANVDAAEKSFEENDPEGVAFEYEVLE